MMQEELRGLHNASALVVFYKCMKLHQSLLKVLIVKMKLNKSTNVFIRLTALKTVSFYSGFF